MVVVVAVVVPVVVVVILAVAVLALALVVEVKEADLPKRPLTLSLKLFDPNPWQQPSLPVMTCQGREASDNLNSHDTACPLEPLKK